MRCAGSPLAFHTVVVPGGLLSHNTIGRTTAVSATVAGHGESQTATAIGQRLLTAKVAFHSTRHGRSEQRLFVTALTGRHCSRRIAQLTPTASEVRVQRLCSLAVRATAVALCRRR